MKKCFLCGTNSHLQSSHIIPSFIGKWLKDTSVTGFLRKIDNPNLRTQDLIKQPLLCKSCESKFSEYERTFANKIFYPYVNKELDDWGIAKGKIRSIPYEEWLLKFIISLQWRNLVTGTYEKDIAIKNKDTKNVYNQLMQKSMINWKKYLLDETKITGYEKHYLIFLQNLIGGSGTLPEKINDKVNTYLLRSVDATIAYSHNNLFLYTKIGPIIIITGLRPTTLKDMNDIIVKKRGNLNTAQHLKNLLINDFIFITRPNEAMANYSLSEIQQKKISKDIEKKIRNSKHLHSVLTSYSDHLLSKRKG